MMKLSKAVKWLEETDFEAKIVVAGKFASMSRLWSRDLPPNWTGNHDITLDSDFYMNHGHVFHNQHLQSSEDCISLFQDSPTITYLCHGSATIRLNVPDGRHTCFNVFGSPFSQRHGLWAFGYDGPCNHNPSAELTPLWDLIPMDTDVIITHTPPRTHCDAVVEQNRPRGCEALRQALWRVRPRLAICGHLHQGRGAECVRWNLDDGSSDFAETSSMQWKDPGEGNNKLSVVDLTGRKRGFSKLANDGSFATKDLMDSGLENVGQNNVAHRLGQEETCVVNAAIMKSSYPHKGGKEFNKPIVVDIDLPVRME